MKSNNNIKKKEIIIVALAIVGLILWSVFGIKLIGHKSTFIVDTKQSECYSNCNEASLPIEKASPMEQYKVKRKVEYMKGIERRKVELAKIAEEKRLAELEAKRIAKQKAKEEAKKKQVVVSRSSNYQVTYEATFYTADCKGCTGQSSSGEWINKSIYFQGYRVVAAPPGIPFFTKLRITLANGSILDAIVLDRGGDIKGKRLDILVATNNEAYQLGRQNVKVEVIH